MKTIIALATCLLTAGLISCAPSASTSTGSLQPTGPVSSGNTYSKDAPATQATENLSHGQQNSLGNTTTKRQGDGVPSDGSKLYSNQPPTTVTEGFKEKYPDYTPGDWIFQDGQYTTVYLNEGKSYQADFTDTGEWLGTQRDVVQDDLPAPVKQTFRSSAYGSASNPRFIHMETAQHPVLYRVEGQVNNQSFAIYITPEGRVVTLPD